MISKLIRIAFLLTVFMISGQEFEAFAQEIQYTYDVAGNRVHREYIILRLATDTMGNGELLANELAEEFGVSLYPNPTQDVINLSITNLPEGEKAVATVFDNSGRELLTKEVFNGITALDFSTFNSGIYHVKLRSGNRELFYKVMKK